MIRWRNAVVVGITIILVGANITISVSAKSNKITKEDNSINAEIVKPAKGINIGNFNILPFPDKIIYINFGFKIDLHWKLEIDDHSDIDEVFLMAFDTAMDSDDEYPYEGQWEWTIARLFYDCPIYFIISDNTGNDCRVDSSILFIIIPMI